MRLTAVMVLLPVKVALQTTGGVVGGVHDSLKRAAAHLPRVDAIGGSAAGVYVNNEVRAAS